MGVAMMFPGQGSQAVGMLGALLEADAAARETFEEASEALGYDLAGLVRHGPEAELNRTDRTQPAMLTAGVAVWRAWCARQGPAPVAMAGHSLGEYTALVCAGALNFPDAVRLVRLRGELMQSAVPEGAGAMAAVLGLDDAQVEAACVEAGSVGVVEAVNFNAPGQVVIAGATAAVEKAIELARAAGARRAVPLPVSVPSHCALMAPAAESLGQALESVEIRAPTIPVFHNVDAMTREDAEGIRGALGKQVHRPVRWVQCMQAMRAAGAGLFVEAGPGRVLAGLARRIDRAFSAMPVEDPDTLEAAIQAATGESDE